MPLQRHRRWLVAAAAALALTGCGSGDGTDDDIARLPAIEPTASEAGTEPGQESTATASAVERSPSPAPVPIQETTPERLATAAVTLNRIGEVGNTVALATRPGDERLWVAQRDGLVVALDDGQGIAQLDLRPEVTTDGEGGLLGLDFSPDGAWLYASRLDAAGDTRIDAYRMADDGIDAGSARTILHVEQPSPFHNGGAIVVDDAGDLWVGIGEGATTQEPTDNARRLDTLLGSLVRITPRPDADPAYTVPEDNPFVGQPGARPEIVAFGLRNPWRIAIDPLDGSVWLGDVGQYAVEEIDRLRRDALGADFGWNLVEGDLAVEGAEPPAGAVPPVHTYRHEGRCAVIGGMVYRGNAIPALRGAYVYGDHCDGRIRALLVTDSGVHHHELGELSALAGFGADGSGEIYALSLTDGVHRLVPAG